MFLKNQKSNISQPQVQNSGFTPPPPLPKTSLPFKQIKNSTAQNLQGTNLVEEHYLVQLQDPVDVTDDTVAFVMHFQPLPNQKKRFFDVETLSTYILNYGGTDLPGAIELCCVQLSGYIQQGIMTNTVAVTRPCQISTSMNPGGLVGYTAVYKTQINPIWEITNINTLTFKIRLQGELNYRSLPTAQPLSMSIKITRVIY